MHIETLPVTPAPATPAPQKVLRGRLRQLAWMTAVTLSVAFWVGLYFLVF